MIKRILITLLVFHLLAIFQSCCVNEFKFRWDDFDIDILDNSGKIPIITEETNLNKNALGFRISMKILPEGMPMPSIVSFPKIKFISECYATSCDNKWIKQHYLIEIQVITLNDYSDNYPANSDITELFKARKSDETKSDYTSLDNIISIINEQDDTYGGWKFDLFLMDKDAHSGEHIFEIRLKFSDDIEMIKQTATLNLY